MANVLFYVPTPPPIGGIDSYTKLMLHMDDTGLTDSSFSDHTPTLNGDVVRSASQSKFEGYSGYFDGDTDYISFANHSDFDFGSGDFTIDTWIYPLSIAAGGNILLTKNNVVGWRPFELMIEVQGAGIKFKAFASDGSDWDINLSSSELTLNQWYHVAFVRSGSDFYLFINGTQEDTGSWAGSLMVTSVPIYVGGHLYYSTGVFNIDWFDGYIDELRVSKGIARWTSNFTPETGPYTT